MAFLAAFMNSSGTVGIPNHGNGSCARDLMPPSHVREWGRVKARIQAIYRQHRPEKLQDVQALLAEWHGQEEELLTHIIDKYGATVTARSVGPRPGRPAVKLRVIPKKAQRGRGQVGPVGPAEVAGADHGPPAYQPEPSSRATS